VGPILGVRRGSAHRSRAAHDVGGWAGKLDGDSAVGNRECGALGATLRGSRAGRGTFAARERSAVRGSAS
jgi:hypothetical protein